MSTKANRVPHLYTARRFAETFMSTLLSWGKSGLPIEARAHVGAADGLTAFVFTLGQPSAYVQTTDQSAVTELVARALVVVPTCDPHMGDLAVFDGRKILMFKRFDERLTVKAARRAAKEVACHILMGKARRRPTKEKTTP